MLTHYYVKFHFMFLLDVMQEIGVKKATEGGRRTNNEGNNFSRKKEKADVVY